ncbi:MAG: DNA-binding protein [Nitrosopumilus sp.]|nr:DNA-binding protein [Nitrosopumilus sp.]
MNDDDLELEKLKAKRLAEMQKNISTIKQTKPAEDQEEGKKASPREIVVKSLGFRGEEVLQNAESQFPIETRSVIDQLAKLILSGEFNEQVDGGQLLSLFRTIGLNVRMNTKINVEQDGKFVSLSEKLNAKKNDE